jgi:hypothetical protein
MYKMTFPVNELDNDLSLIWAQFIIYYKKWIINRFILTMRKDKIINDVRSSISLIDEQELDLNNRLYKDSDKVLHIPLVKIIWSSII